MQKIIRTTDFDYYVLRIGEENCEVLKKREVLKEVYEKITDDTVSCIRFFNRGKRIEYYNIDEERFRKFTDKEFDLIMKRLKKEEKDLNECIVVQKYYDDGYGRLIEGGSMKSDRKDIIRVVKEIYSALRRHNQYVSYYEPADEEYEYITKIQNDGESYDVNILYLDYSQR